MNNRAMALIDMLELTPHPEGGYYKEAYRSTTTMLSPVCGAQRDAVTDIYFLLLSSQVSRFHRVMHDEIWHFYEGDPLELFEIEAGFAAVRGIVLHGQSSPPKFKHCIQGGNWQAARPRGEYSLVGCTVAPGFDFADFEFMAENVAARSACLSKFPQLRTLL